MRKNRFFAATLLIALFGFGLTSCEPEEYTERVITFEDVELGESGYWNGSDLSGDSSSYESDWGQVTAYSGGFISGNLTCNNIYNSSWGSWSGMACSSHTDMDSIGYGNQYSVHATSGARGSENFALICPSDSAICTFEQETEVKSLMINNSTYTYWALKEGKDGFGLVKKFTSGDYFYITITGYDSGGSITGSIQVYLADFRYNKTYICEDWTEVKLESLGKVKKISFKFTSTDTGDYGMNTPGYACIDNIVYIQ